VSDKVLGLIPHVMPDCAQKMKLEVHLARSQQTVFRILYAVIADD
jgi:hypothetical protein